MATSVHYQYRTKGDIVAAQFRELILRGELAPGERIDQRQLADQTGVSRLLVREALTRLRGEGLVHFAAHRGAFVVRLTAEELQDLYIVRATLERKAIELAAPRLTPTRFHALRQAVDSLDRAVGAHDVQAFQAALTEYYDRLYRASEANYLCQLIEDLRDRCRPYLYALWHIYWDHTAPSTVDEIRHMVSSLERHDVDEAVATITTLLQRTVDLVGAYLKQSEEPQDDAGV